MNRPRIAYGAAALLAVAISATPVSGQDAENDAISSMVAEWLAGAVGYPPQVVRWANACITEEADNLPDSARSILIENGAFGPGLGAIRESEPETLEAFLPMLDACVQTMDLGEPILDWIATELPELRPIDREPVLICVMDAVRPIDPIAKEIVYLGDDFGHGIAVANVTAPTQAEGLVAAVEACL